MKKAKAPSYFIRLIAQNWLPTLLFGGFVLLMGFQQDLLMWLGVSGLDVYFEQMIGVGLWITGAFFADRIIISFILDGIIARGFHQAVPEILRTLIGVVILFLAIVGIMSFVFEKSVAGLWATSGVAGIILGIALRPLILDVFSGLAANMELLFKIGDWITIDGGNKSAIYSGWVEEISWRTTHIRTCDDDLVVVPNSFLASSVLLNHSLPEQYSRQRLEVKFDNSIPSGRAIRILQSAMQAVLDEEHGPCLDPAPRVHAGSVGHDGYTYIILYWIDLTMHGPIRVEGRIWESIYKHMSQAGVTVAHPKMDFFVTQDFEKSIDINNVEDRVRFLKHIDLWDTLDEKDLFALARKLTVKTCDKGQTLVAAGDAGSSMFIVIEGLLEVLSKTEDADVRLGQLVPGDFLGEMSLLAGAPRSATVIAATETIVFEIQKSDIEPILTQKPEITNHLCKMVATRSVKNTQSLQKAAEAAEEDPIEDLSDQILGKIKKFFRL